MILSTPYDLLRLRRETSESYKTKEEKLCSCLLSTREDHFDVIFNTYAFNRRSKRGIDVANFCPWGTNGNKIEIEILDVIGNTCSINGQDHSITNAAIIRKYDLEERCPVQTDHD